MTVKTKHQFSFEWNRHRYAIAYDTIGQGKPVLLLPAFSTVSSRWEMKEIAEQIANRYQAVTLDWLGFGESDRPALDYQPPLLHQMLQAFVKQTFSEPVAVIAAGHTSGYALQLAQEQPQACSCLILVAPTWRGPLPTMGVPKPLAAAVRQLVRFPVVGQALYQANTTKGFLRFMYGRHVYVDQSRLTPEFIEQKQQITRQSGARFAPAAFVTGGLDPVSDRQEFVQLLQSSPVPVLVILANQAPPYSKQEMAAMAALPGIQSLTLPGTLGMYEEYAAEVTEAALPFLDAKTSTSHPALPRSSG
ncbi:alpha/beta fold hydrolase [Nostoc sp. LEGE 06077]|uniref:alpha/beta fold hydrolase n=1 Tax=Nostoc sp. LEGE 06077 TaxID=915325 RepID=UPI00187E53C3|nr:alpha/beta fold hydrolase [Nostoc sp. LEGE 06077]MBE9205908.1 alpha/beta fold hydrolase [Nostoc sp. LEGE 06077]